MSRRSSEALAKAAAVQRRRDDVGEALADLRHGLGGAPGRPVVGPWFLPLVAGACGLVVAWSLRRLLRG